MYKEKIPPEAITISNIRGNKTKAMRDLCFEFLNDLSFLTVSIARYYTYPEDRDIDDTKDLENWLDGELDWQKKLNFSVCAKDEIKHHLQHLGDSGEYTFLDEFLDTGKKLYQQLVLYPEDELTEKRTTLNAFIKKTFPYCLRMNTGGWTG